MPVSTIAVRMKSTVQMPSDSRIPIGMSRAGFFASCAAVDTASNPMYAKNITPAPRRMPLHPNSPKLPVLGGMNGVRCSGRMYAAPATMKTTSTDALMTTSTVFVLADSRIPRTSRPVTTRTMAAAGRFSGATARSIGTVIPRSRMKLTK